ncbi:hypothetical protein V8C37DRAFT_257072 [Trichoderma ceciliae]
MPVNQIVPLTINISSTKLKLDLASESESDAHKGAIIRPHTPPADKPVLKAVSFDVPLSGDEDDRRSICQSPSWEAYGRRKKEDKKDHKKEQKKEQLKKEQLKREEERKEQERRDQLKKEQFRKEQLKKEQLIKEQLIKEQSEKEQRRKEQQLKASKREKEESTLRNALIKKKRLSKQPPPTSSPHALEQANRMITTTAVASSRDRQRPSSALEFTTPIKDGAPVRPRHGRSGSFTSLIKAPFESRRASIDTARPSETGFIGGIKLEIQRHAAHQKTVEVPEKMDESKIHPALRTNNAHNQKWSAPPVRPNPDSQRRAYPPITRQPAAAAKTRSLVSSAEVDAPDLGTMEKWRAFVGLKVKDLAEPENAVAQQENPKKPAMANEATKSASALPPPRTNATVGPAVDVRPQTAGVPNASQQGLPTSSGKVADNQGARPKLSILTGDHRLNSSVTVQKPAKGEIIRASNDTSKSGDIADQALTQNLAPAQLSLPPAPPRRSSKRTSLLSLDSSVSSVSSPHSPTHRPSSSESANSNHDLLAGRPKNLANSTAVTLPGVSVEPHASTPPVIAPRERPSNNANPPTGSAEPRDIESQSGGAPLRSSTPQEAGRITRGQKPDPIEIPTWDDIQSSVMRVIDAKVSLSPVRKSYSSLRDDSDFTVRRLTDDSVPTTSADDSSSDDFHSPSMPGTPDTSRPQSEKDIPPMKDAEAKRIATEQHRMRNGSQSPVRPSLAPQPGAVSSRSNPALKNNTTGMSSSVVSNKPTTVAMGQAVHHRPQSETDAISGADFLPKLKHQPLKAMEHAAMPRQHPQSTVLPPGPASYLEEARKAAPLAPPPQILGSPRLGPKVTPPPSIRSQPSPTTDLTPTKALRVTPGSPVIGGEPIAKMFVECCGCKYYHDMPSNLYEAMANPEAVIRPRANVGFTGALSMTVKCPWCTHEMSTKCCAGYAAMVYVKERLH